MCGIVGYVGSQQAAPILMGGLKRLEYRGYDSAGVATVSGGALVLRKCLGKLKNLEELLVREPVAGSVGIGHTRWATHGQPSDVNAHPHTDCGGAIAVAHNGILENYAALRQELSAKGHRFTSATDTEVFAHLIEEHAKTAPLEEAVAVAAQRCQGAFALAVVSSKQPDVVILARLSNPPLIVGLGEGETFAGSDVSALLPHTRRMIFLESGEMAVLSAGQVRLRTFAGASVSRGPTEITWSAQVAEKGGYKHFMLKEIHEQPRVIADCLRGRLDDEAGDVVLAEIPLSEGQLRKLRRVVFVACGTSYYASLLGRAYMEKFGGLPSEADLGSEFRYRDPILDAETLVVAVSQSGETADTLAAVQAAKAKGATVLSICNVVGSALTRESDGTVYIHAGPEICVLSTKTFVGSVAALLLLALYVGRRRGHLGAEAAKMILADLRRVPQLMDAALGGSAEMDRWARLFFKREHFLFLGRGFQYPVALEGALKLKEVSYIHAEGYAGGEMKHGPIALIDENMPVVALMTKSSVYDKMLSNVEETRAREGIVLAVATEGDPEPARHADATVSVPDVDETLAPLLTILPLQLLAYHVAVRRGCDVDQPRNLAKSVTVE